MPQQEPTASGRGARSQTLERALDVLGLLADGTFRSSREIADEIGLHRSIVYRILRTFEDRGIVAREPSGRYLLGLGLAALAESGMHELHADLASVLEELANATRATALFCTAQMHHAVVLDSRRPSGSPASVMVSTGSRFGLRDGAPGTAILSLSEPADDDPDEAALARQTGFTQSKGQPFVGVEALAVPVSLSDGQAASLSVVAPLGGLDPSSARNELRHYATRLTHPGDVWA